MGHHPGKDRLTWYLDEIGKIDLIDRKKEAELAQRIREGETRALQQLARANLRFVVVVAKRYQGQGLPLLDLIAEGNYGLMKAAKRFDETQGNRFITYAVWWIRQTILKALVEHTTQVRLPSNRAQLILKINRVSRELLQVYGREPTASELADQLDIDQRYVYEAHLHTQQYLELEEPYNEDGMRLCEIIPSGHEIPTSKLLKESLKVDIGRALSMLHAREAEITRLYFGLDRPSPLTLEDISKRFDLTRERVRQIKEKALRKLRQEHRREDLQSHVGPVMTTEPRDTISKLRSIVLQLSLKSDVPSHEELKSAHRAYLRAQYRDSRDEEVARDEPDPLKELIADFNKHESENELDRVFESLTK